MARGFVEALKRHSKEVAQLEGSQAEEFLSLLRDLKERLQGRYASLGGQGDALSAFRLREIIGETEAGIKTLEKKALGIYDAGALEAVDLAINHIGEELDQLSTAFGAKPLAVSLDAAKVLADPAQGLLADHFETSVKRYGGEVLNGVRQQLFLGLRSGDSLKDVSQGILGTQGPFAKLGKSNAERLVRTETSHAYGAAQHKGLREASKKAGGLQKVWLHVGSFLCPICGPLHGTSRPLDGTWTITLGKKTSKVAHPPGHPNCSCRASGMKPEWRKGLENLGYLEEQPVEGNGNAEL